MKRKTLLEKNFQRTVLLALKKLENTWFEKISDRVKKGLPDILLCIHGHFIVMELKRSEKEKATPLQKHVLSRIQDAGGSAWVVNPENWEKTWENLLNLAGGVK